MVDEKLVKKIAYCGVAIFVIYLLSMVLINYNAMSFQQNLERERIKNSISGDELIEWKKNQKFNFYYLPLIDSLINANPSSAVTFIDDVSRIYPNENILRTKKGISLFRLDSFDLAINEFNKSVDGLDREQPSVRAYLAWSYGNLDDYPQAIMQMERAVQNSTDITYQLDLAYLYEETENYQKALEQHKLVLAELEKRNVIEVWKEIETLKLKIDELELR